MWILPTINDEKICETWDEYLPGIAKGRIHQFHKYMFYQVGNMIKGKKDNHLKKMICILYVMRLPMKEKSVEFFHWVIDRFECEAVLFDDDFDEGNITDMLANRMCLVKAHLRVTLGLNLV